MVGEKLRVRLVCRALGIHLTFMPLGDFHAGDDLGLQSPY